MTGHEFDINDRICLHYRTMDNRHVIVEKDTLVALATGNSYHDAVRDARWKLR